MLKIIPLFLEIFTKLRRCATVMALFRFGDDILLYLLCFLFGVLGHAKETTDYMRWEIYSRLVESKYVQKVGNLCIYGTVSKLFRQQQQMDLCCLILLYIEWIHVECRVGKGD
jgi:hypothetical protein